MHTGICYLGMMVFSRQKNVCFNVSTGLGWTLKLPIISNIATNARFGKSLTGPVLFLWCHYHSPLSQISEFMLTCLARFVLQAIPKSMYFVSQVPLQSTLNLWPYLTRKLQLLLKAFLKDGSAVSECHWTLLLIKEKNFVCNYQKIFSSLCKSRTWKQQLIICSVIVKPKLQTKQSPSTKLPLWRSQHWTGRIICHHWCLCTTLHFIAQSNQRHSF